MQKRILVVDDNQVIRLIVRSALEMKTPFIVHEACDGVDAVEKSQSLNPDLVVMDADRAGLDAILSKSDGIEPLIQEVQNLLERSH